MLAERIRGGSKIQGFRIREEVVKLSLFADDMTCFLRDRDSCNTFQLIERFSDYSGLKVNHEKKNKCYLFVTILFKIRILQSIRLVELSKSLEYILASTYNIGMI